MEFSPRRGVRRGGPPVAIAIFQLLTDLSQSGRGVGGVGVGGAKENIVIHPIRTVRGGG